MPTPQPRPCQCPNCVGNADHPDREYHRQLNLLMACLDHRQRRLLAALEADRIGRGGSHLVSQITGMCGPTIATGRREMDSLLLGEPMEEPKKIGGRPRTEAKFPEVVAALEALIAGET